ncbi:WD40-repeat-containing domain protein [Lipomyces japonicus]|uniref:WD40-repeat-containing domain protein n=1 Tax=Lipomyces japonicus TaxID=56871 RepID=UPI0034CEDA0A
MPAKDNIHVLVARYLRDNGYKQTLEALMEELGLEDDMIPDDHSMTLESILEQKRLFDLSQAVEELEIDDKREDNWLIPYPSFLSVVPKQVPEVNILFVSVAKLRLPTVLDDDSSPRSERQCILVASADKSLKIFDFYSFDLLKSFTHLHSSPILTLAAIDADTVVTGGMDGRLVFTKVATGEVVVFAKDHFKYLVRITVTNDNKYIATAGYDKKVNVYNLSFQGEDQIPSLSLIGSVTFPTNPEAIAFVYNDDKELRLIASRRDSTFIFYYKLEPTVIEVARHNLNPESNSWVSFCAMDITPDPVDAKLIGVATSTVPHMRFLAVENGVDNIVKNTFTKAPQDAYSSGRITWRPHASGIWCNGDDGIIRGIELSTGNVVAELKHHEGKVKALYSGIVDGNEVLVTGGFDKTIAVWEISKR